MKERIKKWIWKISGAQKEIDRLNSSFSECLVHKAWIAKFEPQLLEFKKSNSFLKSKCQRLEEENKKNLKVSMIQSHIANTIGHALKSQMVELGNLRGRVLTNWKRNKKRIYLKRVAEELSDLAIRCEHAIDEASK
jgi:hypothetical protein